MEMIPKTRILKHNSDTLVAVRKANGFCDGQDVKERIDLLEQWIQEQDHFTKKDFSRQYLESILISAKGSLDKAKMHLEKTCFYKTNLPQFFGNLDIRNDFKEFDGVFTQALLPKLTKEHNRVYLIRNTGKTFQSTLILQFVRIALMFLNYMKEHDYSDGLIAIVDLRDVSLIQVSRKVALTDFRQSAAIIIEAYGTKMKGLHLISSSRIVAVLMWFIKQVLSAKLSKRVHVHQTPDTLHEFVEKEILPHEYGGDESSFESLHEEWQNELSLAGFRSFLADMSNATIDESKSKIADATEESLNTKIVNGTKQSGHTKIADATEESLNTKIVNGTEESAETKIADGTEQAVDIKIVNVTEQTGGTKIANDTKQSGDTKKIADGIERPVDIRNLTFD